MCFSAEASFFAAVLLGAVGSRTLKISTNRSDFFLAAIPMLFAIQQFAEGVLWLSFGGHISSLHIIKAVQAIFLIFAFLIWPVWIPLSMGLVEKNKIRKNIILGLLGCGLILSGFNLYTAWGQDASAHIVNHSIQYVGKAPSQMIIYPLIVLLPCFISSLRSMWILGTLMTLGYLFAEYFYRATFVSVWCFFAAVVSLSVYKILKDNRYYFERTSS